MRQVNHRRWGLPLGGIKSSLSIVCFHMAVVVVVKWVVKPYSICQSIQHLNISLGSFSGNQPRVW